MKSIKRNHKQKQQTQQNLEIFNNLNKQIVRRPGEPAALAKNMQIVQKFWPSFKFRARARYENG